MAAIQDKKDFEERINKLENEKKAFYDQL